MPAPRYLRAVLGLLAVCVVLTAAPAYAQDDEINMRQLARKGTTIQRWTNAPITGADKEVFDQYFDRYYFPEMLKTDPESLGNLAKMRTELFERYIWGSHPSVQQELTKKAYNWAKGVAAGRFPAPLKYNAVLTLGLLDEKYATKNDTAAVPLGAANKLLCVIIQKRDQFPTYLEVAALIGLERHTKHFAALGANEKRATAMMLLEAVDQQEFRPGTTRDVQYWIKLQAASAIANLGVAGKDGVFVDAIAKLIADTKADLGARSAAAMLLEKMNTEGVPPAVANSTVGAVKSLACTIGAYEREAAEKFVDLQRTRGRMSSSLEKSDRYRADENGWVYERKGLAAQLEQLKAGLTAVKPLAGQDATAITAIETAAQSAITAANDNSNIDLDVTDSVRAMADQIDSVAGCKASDAPVVEEEELLGAN